MKILGGLELLDTHLNFSFREESTEPSTSSTIPGSPDELILAQIR